jgi:RNA polymerase sigma factor (sigma-70 family)
VFSAVVSSLPDSLAADLNDAFPALVDSTGTAVYSLLLRVCGPSHADDLAQDVFLRAYQALAGYPPDRIRALKVRPWVLTIALNVARNGQRTAARRPSFDGTEQLENATDGSPAPEARMENGHLRAQLADALLRLPPAAREAVVLRHVVGCSTAEAAAILGRPVGTIKAQVSRGLVALRADLGRQGESA